MMNFKKETLKFLQDNGKTPDDIIFVCNSESWFTAEEFLALADFKYDAGYGGNEVLNSLMVVGKDWWLERGEYDGSEWWEFKQLPSVLNLQRKTPELLDLKAFL